MGNAQATNVQGTLRTNSAYVTITDSLYSYGTIPASGTADNSSDPYDLNVSISTPPGTITDFDLVLVASETTWVKTFSLQIGTAPGSVIWGPSALPNFPPYPTAFIYGVAYDPVDDQIFVCDAYSQNLRVYSSDSTVVYYGAITPPDTVSDVAYSYYDDNLWVTGYKNLRRCWKIDKAGASLRWFSSPANDYGCGMAFNYQDGNEIWFADRRTSIGQTAYIYVSDTLGSATQYNCPIQGYMNARCLGYDSLGHSYIHVNTFFNSGGTTLDSAGIYEYQGVPPVATGNSFLVPTGWNIRGVAFDPRDGNYWITVVQGAPSGDNSIVKVQGFHIPTVGKEEHRSHASSDLLNLSIVPNPITSKFTLHMKLPNRSNVSLNAYDASGRLVCNMINSINLSTGSHSLVWNLKDTNMTNGVYFIVLETEYSRTSQKIVVTK